MRIGDYQLDALQSASAQAAQKRQPAGAVFFCDYIQSEDLAAAVAIHSHRDQARHVDDASVLSALQIERIEPDVLVRARQRSLPKA
jgi:hypothetical protein